MCRYLGGEMVLGNLFIKLIEKEIEELTFNKLYDIIYYTSVKLNEEENTLVLVSRDEIICFAEMYDEFIEINESGDKIKLKKKEELVKCFKARYEQMGREYMPAFEFAFEQIAA